MRLVSRLLLTALSIQAWQIKLPSQPEAILLSDVRLSKDGKITSENLTFYGDNLLTTSNPEVSVDRELLSQAGVKANWESIDK